MSLRLFHVLTRILEDAWKDVGPIYLRRHRIAGEEEENWNETFCWGSMLEDGRYMWVALGNRVYDRHNSKKKKKNRA